MRLDKLIANNTYYSRKDVNKLIRKKLVSVNEIIITNSKYNINPDKDIIKINNEVLRIMQNTYIVLNKPKGYVCSNSNNDGESIFNIIKESYIKNLHIAGRLDKDTTGLVIITNDGDFTHKIKSNKYHVEKEYEVILKNIFSQEMNEKLSQNIYFEGKKLKPFKLSNINKNKLNITLIEGKYHQIKRMFNFVNNSVLNLRRIRIGNIKLENLNIKEGEYLFLSKNEIFKFITINVKNLKNLVQN